MNRQAVLSHHYAGQQVLSLPDKTGSSTGHVLFPLLKYCCTKSSTKYFISVENNSRTLRKGNLHNKDVIINILREKDYTLERTKLPVILDLLKLTA